MVSPQDGRCEDRVDALENSMVFDIRVGDVLEGTAPMLRKVDGTSDSASLGLDLIQKRGHSILLHGDPRLYSIQPRG
ncbi:hypothetical protein GUJ93_ZPchr0010g10959 [Zizania palustris]|uniref:Uncharacterized protein n=1 Tax=Zizania palustris TaxID=103762 RepID=A0A8J5WGK5_ZIZPA|nr:hypothetical protein GUJ93_ZPchr0010g10959 [Zizania palustris]